MRTIAQMHALVREPSRTYTNLYANHCTHAHTCTRTIAHSHTLVREPLHTCTHLYANHRTHTHACTRTIAYLLFSPAASVEQFGGCRRGGGVTVVLSVVVVGRGTHVVIRLEANTAGRIGTVETQEHTFFTLRESIYQTR